VTDTAAQIQMFLDSQDAAEALDPDKAAHHYAEDAVFEFPFAPDGFPSKLEGRGQILEFFRQFPKYYKTVRFLDRTITPLADGAGLIAEYRGEWINIKDRPYNNTYIIVVRFRGDKVVHVREFFNPLVWLESLKPG